jgi:hypothetical protein
MTTSISSSSSSLRRIDPTLEPWLLALRSIVEEPMPTSHIPNHSAHVSSVLPWLFLGPMNSLQQNITEDELIIHRLGITHVLSMNAMQPQQKAINFHYQLLGQGVEDHCYIPAYDIVGYDLLPRHWEECKTFLECAAHSSSSSASSSSSSCCHSPKRVFLHCEQGINRSGTIAAAAMMYFAHMDLLDAIRQLKRQRGIITTNPSFQEQLVVFASECGRLGRVS